MAATSSLQILVQLKDQASAGLKGISKESGGLGSALKTLAVAAGAAMAAFASFKTMESAVSATTDLALSISKIKREAGLTAEEASKLIFAFHHYGLSSDDASRSLGILAKKLKGVSDEETGVTTGGKSTAAILADLGVQATDATGNLRPMGDLIPQIAEVFRAMPDGVEKTGLAMQLFGRSGKDMIPVLNQGSEGLKALGDDAEKLGVVMGDKAVQAAKDYTYAQRDMHEALTGLQIMIGSAVLPTLTNLTEKFIEMLVAARPLVAEGIDKIRDALNALQAATEKLHLDDLVQKMAGNKDALAVLAAIVGGVLVGAFVALGVAAGTAAIGVIAATWPILAIGAAIAGLIATIVLVIRHWDDITAAVERAKAKFMDASVPIKALAIFLALPLAPLIALGVAVNALATHWNAVWEGMKNVTRAVVNAIIEIAASVLDVIAKVIGGIAGVANKIPSWVPGIGAVQGALNGMAGAAEGAAAGLRGLKIAGDAVLSEWNQIAGAIWGTITATARFNDDSALLKNRMVNATTAAEQFTPAVVDLGDAVGGAGGAAEAFRGLDADLAALRTQMRDTAEQGLAVLNFEIAGQQHLLDGLAESLKNAQTEHDDLTKSIQGTTDAMNAWENATLKGTDAYSDTAFRFSQSMDAIQLKINNLTLSKKDKTKTPSEIKVIDAQIAELSDRLDTLRTKAENSRLSENLQLGPLQKQLDDLMHPVQEFSFDQIVAGWKGSKEELGGYLSLLATNDTYMANLQASMEKHQTILDNLKAAYSDLGAALDKVDPAIKAVWESRGAGVVSSIEDAFAAIDRGDKDAATQAMADAQSLFDTIKALVPGAETGIFAPIEKVLKDAQGSINVDISGMADQVSSDLAAVGVTVQKSTGDILTLLTGTVAYYLAGISNRSDIMIDRLVDIQNVLGSVPVAQHGGAVLSGGLVHVEAGETIVPAGRNGGGGNTNVINVGVLAGDRASVERLCSYLDEYYVRKDQLR